MLKSPPMKSTLYCFMYPSDKMDSCTIRAALQILQTNTRAPPNLQTAAEVHSRWLRSTQMNTRLRGLTCNVQRSNKLQRNARPYQRSW